MKTIKDSIKDYKKELVLAVKNNQNLMKAELDF